MKRKKKPGFNVSPAHASQRRLFGQTGAYLFGSIAHPFRNKWGISDAPNLRRSQVDADVTGAVYNLFSRTILFGWLCEQLVHFLYQLQNAPMKSGTGRMEWYYTINPVFGSACLWASWKYGLWFEWYWYAGAFVLPFIWIDGLIWLLFFRLLGWGFVLSILWAVYRILI